VALLITISSKKSENFEKNLIDAKSVDGVLAIYGY
jgi:hypothetical protein